MGALDCLPTVKSCCFCIDLKSAAIVITLGAIARMIALVATETAVQLAGKAKTCNATGEDIFPWVLAATSIPMGISAIVVLYGICRGSKWSTPTVIFIWFLFIVAVLGLVFRILSAVFRSSAGCPFSLYFTLWDIFYFILNMYFVIVMKSYYDEGMD